MRVDESFMPVTIHQLTSTDIALMDGLLAMFGEAFGEVDTYTAKRPGDGYLRRLLGSDTFIALGGAEAPVYTSCIFFTSSARGPTS
jgi:hypothetical protein